MSRWTKTSLLLVVLLTAACAPRFQEVRLPPERMNQTGYSFVPLNEKGWFIGGRNAYQLAMGKAGDATYETFAIQAVLVKMSPFTTSEDFLRLVHEGQIQDTDPRRFKMIKHDNVLYPEKGPYCVRSHALMEDSEAAPLKRTGNAKYMVMEMLALTCAHPKDKRIAVSVNYSHRRFYPEQSDPQFLEKGARLLSSVEFTELGDLKSD